MQAKCWVYGSEFDNLIYSEWEDRQENKQHTVTGPSKKQMVPWLFS